MANFGERLDFALKYRDIRKTVLAYRLGVDRSYITNYIKGKYSARPETIEKIAKILRVSPAWLSGYDVPMDLEIPASYGLHRIPIFSCVNANTHIETPDIIGYEEIDANMVRDGSEYFTLKIEGNSMEPMILNGDYVIVRKQENCDSGDIAIVCINGDEATCKTIIKQANGILLAPYNSNYKITFYSNKEIEDIPVKILGRVVELRRKFAK